MRSPLPSPLPYGYGDGLTERAVEYPWLLGHPLAGRLLDAGSALNHGYVLDVLLPRVSELHTVTLAPEEQAFVDRGVSYLFADLRDLPVRDDIYDAIACISTLEHVGLDNSVYGAAAAKRGDAQAEARRACRELARVAKPGAIVLLTVPYGVPEQLGWVRQLDRAQLIELATEFGAADTTIDIFRRGDRGWQRSSLDESADARYRVHHAEAVACVAMRLP